MVGGVGGGREGHSGGDSRGKGEKEGVVAHTEDPEIKNRECERVWEPERVGVGLWRGGEGKRDTGGRGGGEVMKQRDGNENAISLCIQNA